MKLANNSKRKIASLVATACIGFSQVGHAALTDYSQGFESANVAGDALIGDGFVIGNVVDGGDGWFVGEPAPNSGAGAVNGYAAFVSGEGDTAQGANQLSIFNDYNGWSPFTAAGDQTVQTFTYRDIGGTAEAGDVGKTFRFSFDAKQGNIGGGNGTGTAFAFLKVLKSSDNSFNTLFEGQVDTTSIGSNWTGGFIDVTIDVGMVGELFQMGFSTTAVEWDPSGVFYDNLSFAEAGDEPGPVPGPGPGPVPSPVSASPTGIPIPAWALLLMGGLMTYLGGTKLRARKDT